MTAKTLPELPPLPEPHLSADETDDGLRHYTSDQMRAYALQEREAERERWRAAVEGAAYYLEKARVWNGTEWHYNALHPMFYKPAIDRLREVLGKKQ